MRHPKVMEWEAKLKSVFDRVDGELEDRYGSQFHLSPSRPRRDSTANSETDGLFNVGAAFTAGFGSKTGPGYIIEIRVYTPGGVSARKLAEIEDVVIQRLNDLLPPAFPNRRLDVSRDGHVIKIHGDLSLGKV